MLYMFAWKAISALSLINISMFYLIITLSAKKTLKVCYPSKLQVYSTLIMYLSLCYILELIQSYWTYYSSKVISFEQSPFIPSQSQEAYAFSVSSATLQFPYFILT